MLRGQGQEFEGHPRGQELGGKGVWSRSQEVGTGMEGQGKRQWEIIAVEFLMIQTGCGCNMNRGVYLDGQTWMFSLHVGMSAILQSRDVIAAHIDIPELVSIQIKASSSNNSSEAAAAWAIPTCPDSGYIIRQLTCATVCCSDFTTIVVQASFELDRSKLAQV